MTIRLDHIRTALDAIMASDPGTDWSDERIERTIADATGAPQ